jgi:hypothetical protein
MPAAGDFNPTRFIAKFQRNTPLPPILITPCRFDATSLKPIRNIGHKCAFVKGSPGANPGLMPVEYAPERHLHVPSHPAAPVKLAHEGPADSRLHCRIHEISLSIGGATLAGVSLHLAIRFDPDLRRFIQPERVARGGIRKKEIPINAMGLGFFIKSPKVRP